MKIISVALMVTASFPFILMAGIFAQTENPVSVGSFCRLDKWLHGQSPYQRQVICFEDQWKYENGTIINGKRTILWCYGGDLIGGIASGTCIVYHPGSSRETGASEPAGSQGASPGLGTDLSSGKDSKFLGNDLTVTNDNPPVSDSNKNESTDTSKLKQLIPLGPLDSATTDEGDSADSNEEPNKEIDNNGDNDND